MPAAIAFFSLRFLPWSETFQYELIRNIKSYEPVFLCRTTENLDRFPLVKVESMSSLSTPRFLYNSISLKLFKHCDFFEQVVRKHHIKILNACFGDRAQYLLKLSRAFRLPLVTFFYGDDATRIPRRNPHFYDQLFKDGDLFVVCSKSMVPSLVSLGCPKGRLQVLHKGIDLNKFKALPRKVSQKIRLISVGRLVEKKGFSYLIEAFAQVANSNVELTIVGDGPLRNELVKMAGKLPVRFTGSLCHDKVAEELLQHHIFVSPVITASDGAQDIIPNTLVEAQSTGMPVISTTLPGNSEAVLTGRTGLLVPEKDASALAAAMQHLISDPTLCQKMGRLGRRHVEKNFDIQKQVMKLEKLYSSLLM